MSPETRAPYAADAEPVEDLRCWRAYLAWIERYRRLFPGFEATAALQDAFKYAFYAGLFEGEGSR